MKVNAATRAWLQTAGVEKIGFKILIRLTLKVLS